MCLRHSNYENKNVLSRASEAGSPTNRLSSGQRRDTDLWTDHLKIKKIQANIRPVLVRQGEPGTPQYIFHHVQENDPVGSSRKKKDKNAT